MEYIKFETGSIKDFTDMLLETGTTWYGMTCRNSFISNVTVDGKSINRYLPRQFSYSDGSMAIEEPSEFNLMELLEAAKEVIIHSHDREAYVYTIKDGEVVFKEYEREDDED